MIPQTYAVPTWEIFPETAQAPTLSAGMQAVQSVDTGSVQPPVSWDQFPAADSFPVASDAMALQSLSDIADE
jgi:hypothetical protein